MQTKAPTHDILSFLEAVEGRTSSVATAHVTVAKSLASKPGVSGHFGEGKGPEAARDTEIRASCMKFNGQGHVMNEQ